jgi:predicted acyl esterase
MRRSIACTLLAVVAGISLSFPAVLSAQRRFVPVTISIPMRDGKSLAADFYSTDTTVRRPTILIQTPYNKNFYRLGTAIPDVAGGTPFPADSAHYDYVIVDWRGYFASADAQVPGYDHGLDGYDCVEWIAKQPWSDGTVGTWGPSALGAVQYMTAKHRPPHLGCAVPVVEDFKTSYDRIYYGGDLRKEQVATLDSLGFTSTAFDIAHPTHDAAWRLVETATDYPDSIAVPMLVIEGWFDHYPDDVLRAFEDLRTRSAPEVRAAHRLMVGPWSHSAVGKAEQGELEYPDVEGVSNAMALRFFDRYLRGLPNGIDTEPAVRYYQMGENAWHTAPVWGRLADGFDTLFLASGGALLTAPEEGSDYDPLPYDPRNPAPSIGGARFDPYDRTVVVGPADQRALVESRSDVLVYTTPVLDRDLVVDGPVDLDLFFSSDRTDSDIGVRLCDVYPDGRSMILTQGIRRLRFRNGFDPSDTAQMTPGTVYPVTVDLQNIAMTFPKGHRLRIDVSSSLSPMYDINPNTGGPLYAAGDTLVAANRIHRGAPTASRLVLPTVKGSTSAAVAVSDFREAALRLDPPVPNPSSGSVRLTVHLPVAGEITLSIESLLGEHVATIHRGVVDAGVRTFRFDTGELAAGTYLCRLVGASGERTQLVTVMK